MWFWLRWGDLPAMELVRLSQSPSVVRVGLSHFAHGGAWRNTVAAERRAVGPPLPRDRLPSLQSRCRIWVWELASQGESIFKIDPLK